MPNHVAHDIMHSDVITVHPGAPLYIAQRKLNRYGINALPVVEEGVLVGIMTLQDLQSTADTENEIIADHMSMPVITCLVDDPVEEVRNLLNQYSIGQVPVLERDGSLAGIITWEDINRETSLAA